MADMAKVIEFDGETHEFPDDFTDDDIRKALKAHSGRTPVKAHSRAQRKRPEGWAKAAGEALPAIGATVGGVLGGTAGAPAGGIGAVPGAVVGAGVGGMAGANLRDIAYRAAGYDTPEPFSAEALAGLGAEGAWQAGLQRFVPGSRPPAFARGLMRMTGGVTPEVAETLVRERLPISDAGLAKAEALKDALGRIKRVELARAGRGGFRQRSQDLLDEAYQAVANDIHPAERAVLLPQLAKLRNAAARGMNPRIAPPRLEEIRRGSDAIAGPYYNRAAKLELPADMVLSLRVRWHKALADAAREKLNVIPGMFDLNQRIGALKDATRTVAKKTQYGMLPGIKEQVASRSAGAVGGALTGYTFAPPGSSVKTRALMGFGGAVVGGAAASPQAISALALALGNPLLRNAIVNPAVPRTLDWAGRSVMP